MDDSAFQGASVQEAFSKLTPADQKEIVQMVQQESQKAQVQGAIHDLTDVCWKKCIASNKISGGKLSSSEQSCTENCVGRFMDTSYAVLAHLDKLRSSQ